MKEREREREGERRGAKGKKREGGGGGEVGDMEREKRGDKEKIASVHCCV